MSSSTTEHPPCPWSNHAPIREHRTHPHQARLDDIEDGALQQARNLANLPFVHKWVAIMPDSHQGYGMPIGGVLATKGVIIPNAVGVDIGCGMGAVQTSIHGIDTDTLKAIMGRVREAVPVGFNHHKEAQALCERWHVQLPDKDLAFLPIEDQAGHDYYAAMSFCLEFAQASRDHMMSTILGIVGEVAGGQEVRRVNIHHNYAAMENHYGENVWVHRKGATRVSAGEAGIIPGSMGTASYIVEGLGNPESFYSCSHGAGRKMGRKQAERSLDLAEEQAKMDDQGIVHGLRGKGGLDEAPGAYKDIDAVMANQTDLVKITTRLRPLGSIKG